MTMNNIEIHYYETTLPLFLSQHLTEALAKGELKLGQLQLRMYCLCQKTLQRQRFLQLLLQQLTKLNNNIQQLLLKDPQNIQMLKNSCKTQLYIWKIKDEIKIRNKSVVDPAKQKQQNEQQKQQLHSYTKLIDSFWKIKLELTLVDPDQIEDFIIQILRDIADSQRISTNFKQNIRSTLSDNDFTPVERYMKIIGDENLNKSTPSMSMTPKKVNSVRNQNSKGTPQNPQLMNSAKTLSQLKETYLFSPHYSHSQRAKIIQPNKRIEKGRTKQSVGRTLYISHPIKYRARREQKTKQLIQYVDAHQI